MIIWENGMKIRHLLAGLLLGVGVSVAAGPLTSAPAPLDGRVQGHNEAARAAWNILASSVEPIHTVTWNGNTRVICTAWKLDDQLWATAEHCTLGNDYNIKGKLPDYIFRGNEDAGEDYGVYYFKEPFSNPALEIDCEYIPVVGDRVAYVGFPGGIAKAVFVGYVNGFPGTSGDERVGVTGLSSDFYVHTNGTGGASGSPVVNLESGKVVGIVVEGMQGVMMGAELISSLDLCDGKKYQQMQTTTGVG